MQPTAILSMARGKGKTIPIKVNLINNWWLSSFFSRFPDLTIFVSHLVHLPMMCTQLVSSAGTGYFYTTRRNVTATPEKFKFVKFDPIVRRRVLFTEAKIK
jgi:large subunit ribosomal protein L33